jgi:hypothetical protein
MIRSSKPVAVFSNSRDWNGMSGKTYLYPTIDAIKEGYRKSTVLKSWKEPKTFDLEGNVRHLAIPMNRDDVGTITSLPFDNIRGSKKPIWCDSLRHLFDIEPVPSKGEVSRPSLDE